MPVIGSTLDSEDKAPDFETAIEACGFGLFNLALLLATTPGLFSAIFEFATMSYVLPAAECDLELTIYDKGNINSMAFAGAVVSALPWGFVADTYGRRKVLICGLLLVGILTLFSSVTETVKQLMIFKFFGGFLSSGPIAVFVSYISEFHSKKYRVYVIITLGMINSLPLLILPILAFVTLPKKIEFDVGNLKYNSWKVFIAITAFPPLLSGCLLIFFPESPKFLMSQGRNEEALKAFQRVYAINRLKSKEPYPIDDLYNEAPEKSYRRSLRESQMHKSFKQRQANFYENFKGGFMQIRPLCSKTYVGVALLVYTMFFCLLMSVNAIRLWIPQFFATTKEMENKGLNLDTCNVLKYSVEKIRHVKLNIDTNNENCELHLEPASYFNNIIVAGCILFTYVLTTFSVKFVGNNILFRIYFVVASVSLFTFYWSNSQTMSLVLACIYVSTGVVSMTLVVNAAVNVFPTTMRTMAVITILSCGRFGSVLGNVLLPYLMRTHCISMFAFFSASILCTLVTSFFVPNTTKQNLK